MVGGGKGACRRGQSRGQGRPEPGVKRIRWLRGDFPVCAFGAPGSLGTLGEEGEVCKRIRWDRIREKDTWVRNLRFFLGRVKGGWIVPHVIRRGIDRKIPRNDSPPQLMLLNPRSLMHQTEENTVTGNTKTRGTACMRCRKLKVHCTGSLPW